MLRGSERSCHPERAKRAEVLSRTFRRLEDDGILEAAPYHVTIHDPDSLRSLVELIE